MRRRLPALALAALAACAGGHPAAMHRRTSRVTDAGTFATVATTAPTTTTVLAPGPGTVAAELAAVESGVRDPSAAPAVLDDLGRRQLTAYRLLAHHPDWFDQVARQVSDGLRSAVTHNFTAEVELQALTPPRTELPPWRVLPPR